MSKAIRFPIFPAIVLVSGLTACSSGLLRHEDDPVAIQADRLVRSGQYAQAIGLYEQLAQTTREPDYFRLRAADAAMRAGDSGAARNFAGAIHPQELEEVDRNQWFLLQAKLDLAAGQAGAAMAKLSRLDGKLLPRAQEWHYHTLRASAFNQSGDMLASARERVLLEGFLEQPEQIAKNHAAIHDDLARLPDAVLAGRQPAAPDPLAGWMELTRILKNHPHGKLAQPLAAWRTRFPNHPADGDFLQSRLTDVDRRQVQIQPLQTAPVPAVPAQTPAALPGRPFVGVLLPMTGPYAAASTAIRAGLDAAWQADPDPAKAELRYVDSQSGEVYALYRKLADEGARRVIGPLVKENVAALARGGDLPVPVLALNQVADANHERLYQFGLAPEQEVEQAAGSAWLDGKQNALVLAPADAFGQRLIKFFTGYWKQINGRILAVKTYPRHGGDFAGPIQGLLAAANPVAEGIPTSDFIFLVADTQDAHSILPQLAFHGGGQLPVYATSHVYNGLADTQANQDLNGLVFCEVPWLLNPNDNGPLSVHALESQARQTPPEYLKLIALGLDAYRLAPELEPMKADPQFRYDGATGSLSLGAGNHIRRQLHCARFEEGLLQPRGPAPVLEPGTVGR